MDVPIPYCSRRLQSVLVACGVAALLCAPQLRAATLSRGPYLQNGTTTNILVRWRTVEPSPGQVRFGLRENALVWTVQDLNSGINHTLALTNLAPGTRYYYSIGTGTEELAGGPGCHFSTAPSRAKPTRIWAIGDAGTSNQPLFPGYVQNQRGVRDAYYSYTAGRDTDVMLLLGDNAYGNGTDPEYQVTYFQFYPDLIRTTVAWAAIGNHDVQAPSDAYTMLDIFSMPTQGEAGGVPSGNQHYYSFNYGNIHFVCLDSEISRRDPAGPMLTWLASDLAANTNDWLIAYWHSPPYTKGSHDSDFESHLVDMRTYAVPILESYGVDLVLCGHSHNYERSYLLNGHYGKTGTLLPGMLVDAGNGRTNGTGAYRKTGPGPSANQGAVYVVAGSSGWATPTVGLNHPAMFIGLQRLGSMVIDVDGNRLDALFLRETGAIDDSFTIIKSPRINTFTASGRSGNTVSWTSIVGRTYRVDRATRLDPADWQLLSPDLIARETTTTWTDPTQNVDEKRFYRVRQVN